MTEQTSPYAIVDLGTVTGSTSDPSGESVANYAPALERVGLGLSPSADLKRVIADWSDRHGFALSVYDVDLDTDEDDDVRIILPDLTIDAQGDIVVKRRAYTVTAQYTVDVLVTVEAKDEDEARELVEDELYGASFDLEWVDGGEVVDVDYRGITDVDEQ